MENGCSVCDMLEKGDSLYQYGEDDVGIVFERIENIQFCPACGKKLLSFEEKYPYLKRKQLRYKHGKANFDHPDPFHVADPVWL